MCFKSFISLYFCEENEYTSTEIRKDILKKYGQKISLHSIPTYGKKLSDLNLIAFNTEGQSSGKWIINTSKFPKEIFNKFFVDYLQINTTWPRKLILSSSFEELHERMVEDTEGEFLEYIAAKFCWHLGIKNLSIRNRDGQLEKDIYGKKVFPFYSNFLIQCKNHPGNSVNPSVIMREYGIANIEKINNIFIFSSSGYTSTTRLFANNLMTKSNINIYLFGYEDILSLTNGSSPSDILEKENNYIESIRDENSIYSEKWVDILLRAQSDLIDEKEWKENDYNIARNYFINNNLISSKFSKKKFKELYLGNF